MPPENYADVGKEVQKELYRKADLIELVTETSREIKPDEWGVKKFLPGIHRICIRGAVQVEFETNVDKRRIRNLEHIKQVASEEYAVGYIMGEAFKAKELTSAHPDEVYAIAINLCMLGG